MKKHAHVMIPLFLPLLFWLGCSPSEQSADGQSYADQYQALQQSLKERSQNIKSREDFTKLTNDRKQELEALLEKGEKLSVSDERELIRSKIYLQLLKLDEAEQTIKQLLAKDTPYLTEAKMVMVQFLIAKDRGVEALPIFREIESSADRNDDLFSTYLWFAFRGGDPDVREEYSNKFLSAQDVPEGMSMFKARIHSNLAAVAYQKNDIVKAKELLGKALELTTNPMEKNMFQQRLTQLEQIGQPAPPLNAETWINSPRLSLDRLKGRVVVIDFWATWCQPCRDTIPALIELHEKYRSRGVSVIGFTKLFGSYRDDIENKGKVDKTEEIALIKQFVERYKIPYPVAVSVEGESIEKYAITGYPSMVFVDKEGKIQYVKIGANQPETIEEKIKELLAGGK